MDREVLHFFSDEVAKLGAVRTRLPGTITKGRMLGAAVTMPLAIVGATTVHNKAKKKLLGTEKQAGSIKLVTSGPSYRTKEGLDRLARIMEAKRLRRAAKLTTKSAGFGLFGSAKKTRKLVPVTKVVRGNRTVTVPTRPSRATENRLASKYLESLGVAR